MKHLRKISLGLIGSGILASPVPIILIKNQLQNNSNLKPHHSTNIPFNLTLLNNFKFIDNREKPKSSQSNTTPSIFWSLDIKSIVRTIILGN